VSDEVSSRAPPLEAYNGMDTIDEIWNNENDPGEVSLHESLTENVYNPY